MKKVYTLAILMLFTSALFAQKLSEGFEGSFPPTGWSKQNPDGGTGWEQQTVGVTPLPGWNGGVITSAPVNGGFSVAFCTYTTGGAASNDQWLITPQVTPAADDSLMFWMHKFSDQYADFVDIKVSTAGNGVADFITSLATINYALTDTGWVYYSFPLGAYAGQSIYIAFQEMVSDNVNSGAAITLDNVLIHNTNNVGVEDIVQTEMNMYPNPAEDFVTLESDVRLESVVITNSLGQIVKVESCNDFSATIDVSDLASGTYLLTIVSENGKRTEKLQVK